MDRFCILTGMLTTLPQHSSGPQAALLLKHLGKAYAIKTTSLADYITTVQPFVGKGDQALADEIGCIAADDRRAAVRLGEVIDGLRGVANQGCYDEAYGRYAFLSISYLGTVLKEHLQQEREVYRRSVEALQEHPQTRALFEGLIGDLDSRLARLGELLPRPDLRAGQREA